MKYSILIFLIHFSLNAQKNKYSSFENIKNDTINIAVLLYDNVVLQDFSGPIEVFSKAKNLTDGKYNIFTIGLDSRNISTENKLVKITTDYTLNNFPPADYVIIPGANMKVIEELKNNHSLIDFIKKENNNPYSKIVSICTASYLLAYSNILNNKMATTHYFVAHDFSEKFPEVKLIRDVRFVDEGKIITSSGITSGIDVELYIVGLHSGKRIQEMINNALQYNYGHNQKWPTPKKGMKYKSKS